MNYFETTDFWVQLWFSNLKYYLTGVFISILCIFLKRLYLKYKSNKNIKLIRKDDFIWSSVLVILIPITMVYVIGFIVLIVWALYTIYTA